MAWTLLWIFAVATVFYVGFPSLSGSLAAAGFAILLIVLAIAACVQERANEHSSNSVHQSP